MKTTPATYGGWMHYISSVKSLLKRSLTKKEYRIMMSAYLAKTPAEDAVKQLGRETNG